MGNPFSSIADSVSDFAGDIADAWNGKAPSAGGEGKYLSYPNALGNASDSTFSFDSDVIDGDLNKYTDARAEDGGNDSAEPFIMFEFFRVIEPNYEERDKITTAINAINAEEKAEDTGKISWQNTPAQINKTNARNNVINTLTDRKKALNDQKGKKNLNQTIALYMTPSIAINDSMSYEQESRKLAAIGEDLVTDGLDNFNKEDAQVGIALASGAAVAGIASSIGSLAPGNIGALIGGGGGAALGQALGDEAMRQMGKALNPNEYMQYKNTQLRSFSFNWKFLPDSMQESLDCEDIIKAFRGAAHAHRKSAVTLTVPDQVVVSFHGVSGMPALPATVISNVSVTYNPNSASFFKQNNNPVEVDLSITLNEIMPIYRDDIETKGY